MRFLLGCAALLMATTTTSVATWALAADVFELEPEYVYGKNRKPRLGYRKPEVFDPLSDQLYRSGYRDYPPTAIPDEYKQLDALTRTQKMGRIMACADGWFFPFSRTARKNEAPGYRYRDPAIDCEEAWLGSRRLLGQHGHPLGPRRCRRCLRPQHRQGHLRHRLWAGDHRRRSPHGPHTSWRSPALTSAPASCWSPRAWPRD